MAENVYDHIIVGAGALGSATAYWLSRTTGGRVLVCEQFSPGHPRGSSDDHSRIIRHAYHSPIYTALTPAAYQTWEEVEQDSGRTLLVRTGGLDFAVEGTPGFTVLRSYQDALDAGGIPYDVLDAAAVRAQWPQWNIDDGTTALYQRDGGFIDIRRATRTHLDLAVDRGVTVMSECVVRDVEATDTGVDIRTSKGDFSAGSLVLCAGSWLSGVLDRLGSPFTITLSQEQVQYFAADDLDQFAPTRFPIWIWHGDEEFYGIPVYGERAVKAARDMAGKFVTVDTRGYEPDPAETALVRAFLRERLPACDGRAVLAKTCVYDLSRDRDLIVDAMPGHPRVFVAVGAGHAGKFASLIGRVLTDLVLDGRTRYPVEAFRADRPSLAPTAPVRFHLGAQAAGGAASGTTGS
ncbi:N-methyl-L-tryptophan oxidase [Saccharothrix coeruleofusca]|uniref:N-methyl-L-tryptophan oxidase n=1 Tax=Saccharothrix coeruleofusca TaxID=33919 RepID=A0A918AUC6_9PSEU|nr:N-methyl-L-tryptophan oxidase [Saccharothrix coeruleofusca]MBP2335987.1 sarcosine oxidase [Saccharothrix coeruleofusca]GGP76170.1 N-methyl-L-tryptophan oxidase [Saccharothrix coeruleofusca]